MGICGKYTGYLKVNDGSLIVAEVHPVPLRLSALSTDTVSENEKTDKWMTLEHWKDLEILLGDLVAEYERVYSQVQNIQLLTKDPAKCKTGTLLQIAYKWNENNRCCSHFINSWYASRSEDESDDYINAAKYLHKQIFHGECSLTLHVAVSLIVENEGTDATVERELNADSVESSESEYLNNYSDLMKRVTLKGKSRVVLEDFQKLQQNHRIKPCYVKLWRLMESVEDGPSIADGEEAIADSSKVIYLIEDDKPEDSDLSLQGADQGCPVKRVHQEEHLSHEVERTLSEDYITIEHKNSHTVIREDHNSNVNHQFSFSPVHTGEESFECNYCEKEFSRKFNLVRHIRVHTGEKPFNCTHCEKEFSLKTSLNSHKTVHTGEKSFECNNCDKVFSIHSNLSRHQRVHTGEKPFKCNYCVKTFSRKCFLTTHLRVHSGEKPFKCKFCDMVFSDSSSRRRHQNIHAIEKPFKCKYCEKAFSQKIYLTSHMRRHTGEKPFKCSCCGEAFVFKSNLFSHQRVHTREKPFECNYCHKEFSRKFNLAVHIRLHTCEKPCKCNYCEKKFTSRSALTRHTRVHIDEE